MPVRSHVREALAQLRRWVPVAGGVVALASLVQLFVFAFVHFTDIRWTDLSGPEITNASISSVEPPVQFQTQWELAQRQLAGEYQPPPDVNRVESGAAVVLKRANQTAVFLGVVGVVGLVSLTTLGCVIAGGGAVPGVHKILGASGGAMLLGVASIPWSDAFPSVPIAGVFTGYVQMSSSSDLATGTGSISLLAMHAFVPLAVLIGAVFIALRFMSGVDEGFILSDAADADDVLSREVAAIEKHGISSNTSTGVHVMRTIGRAQGEALGRQPADAPTGSVPDPVTRRPL